MKPTFRVVIALVHTGSRLASGDCGTKISVFAAPPIAGRASVAAAVPSRKLRRCMCQLLLTFQNTTDGPFRMPVTLSRQAALCR